ncbi:FHA domain-containing protein [Actinotalea sp. Marseille-Q4924]|uniref:FHA domain-containing protein n=1 Tax=Actinotalea sp. Marseille-Q4924 TaxID=2866571 RepID=UPI001CE41406|nr:FHA domain-containing protein [Actinotalea sp. Marseille-Q4924]
MIVPRYAPGGWFAVVTDGHVCLLPPDVDRDTVTTLWAAVRDGAGLTAQLQLLLAGGLDALPPFALVSLERDRVHVVVRGDVEVQVDADEPRTVRGRRVATWQEEVVDGAFSVVARVLDGAAGADATLPVLSAVVHAGAVAVDLRARVGRGATAPVAPPVAAPVAAPVAGDAAGAGSRAAAAEPVRVGSRSAATGPTGVRADAAEPVGVRPGSDVSRPEVPETDPRDMAELDDLEHTVLHASTDTSVGLRLDLEAAPEPAVVPAPAAVPAPAPAPAPAPVPAPAPAPAPEPTPHDASSVPTDATVAAVPGPAGAPDDADHDGTTVLSSDVVALRRQLPEWAGDGVPGPLAVPAPNRPAPAKIRLSSGLVVSLNRPVLLGRAPQVSRVSNREMPRLITVASPRQDISRTHAEVRMDGDDVLVTDLRSTNGVLLLRQGHGPQRLHPGEPTVVEPGVSVDLGEGVTFAVERGA